MTAEDRKWLEQVMKECVIDEVERMKQISELLKGGNAKEIFKDAESDVKQRVDKLDAPEDIQTFKEDMLEYLHDLVENLDNAKAFMLVGGFEPIIDIVRNQTLTPHERKLALEVLGACAQNNPPCQAELQKMGVLALLLDIVKGDPDANVRLKALGALSSLCRGHTDLEKQLVEAGGVALLLLKLQTDDNIKVKRKSLFFLRALFFSRPETKVEVAKNGICQTLSGFVGADDIDLRESCLNAMIELSDSSAGLTALKEAELGLSAKLDSRKDALQQLTGEDAEVGQEEAALCGKLQDLIVDDTGIFTAK